MKRTHTKEQINGQRTQYSTSADLPQFVQQLYPWKNQHNIKKMYSKYFPLI